MKESHLPVTLKMIAKAAGVTHPTVSRALRDDSRNISEATRKRIQAIAKSMGYRPDPAMSALIAHRSRVRPHGEYGKLAILNSWGKPVNKLEPFFKEQIAGMVERAAELGYDTEVFAVAEDPTEQAQLSRILWNRGIRGLIVGPLPVSRSSLELDWEKFHVVSVGYSLVSPRLHYVASNHLATIETIYAELRKLGYFRIGYFHERGAETRNRHLYLASYLKSQAMDGLSREVFPPLLMGLSQQPTLSKWLARHQFDAVICGGTHEFQFLKEALAQAGRRIPQDLGVAVFPLPHGHDHNLAGVLEDWHSIGTGAINLLHSLILSGKRGVPVQRNSILIDGIWRPGRTVRNVDSSPQTGKSAKPVRVKVRKKK